MVASEHAAARLSLMEVSVRINIDAFAATEPMDRLLDAGPSCTDTRYHEKSVPIDSMHQDGLAMALNACAAASNSRHPFLINSL